MLKTWDIFDTLIARRCIFPQEIFKIVEQTTGAENFATIRVAAEQNVLRRGVNYNLDDIYAELRRLTNAPQNICDGLKNFEVETEIEQSIPITENLQQVKAGDILVSDMYLPENIIRKMLDKAGLIAPVEIVITSGGKSSGRIWKQIADQNKFLFHIGDNMASDVHGARVFGFESAITILSHPNILEQWLMKRDFEFAAYLREIRLRNPFTEEIKRTYWEIFTLNIGILIILVQLIDELQKRYGFEYLGFCGRDMYYLWLLYKKFKDEISADNSPVASDYLYYSRKLFYGSEIELVKYFREKIAGRKTLMIDLTGTGIHLHRLRAKVNVNYTMLICFGYGYDKMKRIYPDATNYPENWRTLASESNGNGVGENFHFISTDEIEIPVIHLEHLNRATHNSPIKLSTVHVGKKIIPDVTFSEISDTENFDVFEACIKEVLNSKIVWGGGTTSTALIDNLKEMIKILTTLARTTVLTYSYRVHDPIDLDCMRKNLNENNHS